MAKSGYDMMKIFSMFDSNASQRLSEDELGKALDFLRVDKMNRRDI
jgi:Ca2+-binding EF-hand superfamily protein